jgi:hypothetical protein
MKVKLIAAAVAGLILAPCALIAQAPPAGATGKCKDGTYTTAATKSGACKGHKGIDTWLAATPAKSATSSATTPAAPASTSAAKPAAASTPAAKPASSTAAASTPASSSTSSSAASKSTASKSTKTAAPGGGPGLVWLNTTSKVYHCYGGADYGTTKAGKYMSEADAKAAGGHAAGGKACSAK